MQKPPIISNYMHGCNMGKWCLPSVSKIQISLTLFNVYTLQHARFQITPHRSPLYSCMHGFKHQDILFKYLNSTLHWLWPHLFFCQANAMFETSIELYMTGERSLLMDSTLHPHSSLLFIIVPLTFSRACMHTHYQSALSIARIQSFSSGRSPMKAHTHTHPPLHHIGHSLSLTRACTTIDVPLCMCVYS